MEKIKVDYESMASKAKQIREYGKELNFELVSVYKNIGDMHNYWNGKRYIALAREFNSIVSSINELLKIVVNKIPCTLEKIANNYSQADNNSNITTVDNQSPSIVNNISIYNDTSLKFITNEVSAIQQKVTINFRNVKEKLDKIESTSNSITWQSESASIFRNHIGKLKNDIVTACEELNNQFTNLINQAKEDIQIAENASTVD